MSAITARGLTAACVLVLGGLASAGAPALAQAPIAGPPASQPEIAALRARSAALAPAQQAQARALFSSAFKLWQAGDFQAAELGFAQGLQIDPANGTANFYYGDTLQRRDDPQARTYMANAAALAPATPEGLKAQVFLQEKTKVEQAKVQSDKQVADAVARYAAVLPGKWKIRGDGWSGATLTLSMDANGKPQSSGWYVLKSQRAEFQGDDLILDYHGCVVWSGCSDAEFRFHLVSPTRMEGSERWTGRDRMNGAAHADKVS